MSRTREGLKGLQCFFCIFYQVRVGLRVLWPVYVFSV
jgi:hypothetical protein